MEIQMKPAVHNKTGNTYYIICDSAIDCTNIRDGEPAVVYYRDGMFFVRDKKEFEEKFTLK